jgi:prolycopene isomerase
VIPGVRGRIAVLLSASAKTSWRFTLNSQGAMLGWEMSPEQLGDGRPGIRGPVDGLYLVGHWTRPGGGITPVIVSAMRAAEAVLGGATAGLPAVVVAASGPSLPAAEPFRSPEAAWGGAA